MHSELSACRVVGGLLWGIKPSWRVDVLTVHEITSNGILFIPPARSGLPISLVASFVSWWLKICFWNNDGTWWWSKIICLGLRVYDGTKVALIIADLGLELTFMLLWVLKPALQSHFDYLLITY